jgi:hypothetical protein
MGLFTYNFRLDNMGNKKEGLTMPNKTTVQIDKTVMLAVKLAAIQQDISYSAYIEMAVKRCIEQDKQGDLFKEEKG